jgi:hypothetical protein
VNFAFLKLGLGQIHGGVRFFSSEQNFQNMISEIHRTFNLGDFENLVKLFSQHFPFHDFQLKDLFKDELISILNDIYEPSLNDVEQNLQRLYHDHQGIMQLLDGSQIQLPRSIALNLEMMINTELRKLLEADDFDIWQFNEKLDEAKKWHIEIDVKTIGFLANKQINALLRSLSSQPRNLNTLKKVELLLIRMGEIPLKFEVWENQNLFFKIYSKNLPAIRIEAEKGIVVSKKIVELYDIIGKFLGMNMNPN